MKRHRLAAPQMAAYFAGKFMATRDHWMNQARLDKITAPDLCAMSVQYARNAHRCYLNHLRIAARMTP